MTRGSICSRGTCRPSVRRWSACRWRCARRRSGIRGPWRVTCGWRRCRWTRAFSARCFPPARPRASATSRRTRRFATASPASARRSARSSLRCAMPGATSGCWRWRGIGPTGPSPRTTSRSSAPWRSSRPSPSATRWSTARPARNARWRANCAMPAKSSGCCCRRANRWFPATGSAGRTCRHGSSAATTTTTSTSATVVTEWSSPTCRARAWRRAC